MSLSKKIYNDPKILLRDLQTGNTKALQAIYELHHRSMWFFARSILRDGERASDLVGDCFLKFWERRAQFSDLTRIGPYLFKSVRNACITKLSRHKIRVADHAEIAQLADISEEQISTYELHAELIQLALLEAANLPEKMKAVFTLLYVDGLTIAQVAEKLNISVTTVSAQKINAIKRIRDGLDQKRALGAAMIAFLNSYL